MDSVKLMVLHTVAMLDVLTTNITNNDVLSISKGGVNGLDDYILDRGIDKPNHSDISYEVIYLVIRDFVKESLYQNTNMDNVCKYLGVDQTKEKWKISVIKKANNFNVRSISDICNATGIKRTTLHKWSIDRPILFHSIIEFTAKSQAEPCFNLDFGMFING